jgi:hypothetical protein
MRKAMTVACCLTICSVVLLAAPEQRLQVKTGLWQIDLSVAYKGLPPEMQAMLEQLTPEQRAAMGIGGTRTDKRCVTDKQINTSWVDGDHNCKWTVLKATNTDLEVNGTACRASSKQGWISDVIVKIHVADPEHLQGAIHGTATGRGIDATIDGSYKGKWIAETCPNDSK